MITPDPDFRLIDVAGKRSPSELPSIDPQVEAASGAAGVVAALTSVHEQVCLIRDASLPVTGATDAGLWLQTSGTTGPPKWVRHDPATLTAHISPGREKARWLLTYHPASFAGVQVILSALKGGHDLIAPPAGASLTDMAEWAVTHQATHISGTPTFWRGFVMTLSAEVPLRVATLGGEAVDQGLINALRIKFPKALIRHIYATTETGVVFTVTDGRAGFPADWLKEDPRLSLTANDTLSVNGVDTGDVIAVEGDRALFKGRSDSVVNIGGTKVFPEAVEAFILKYPEVLDARISARPNPITGHVLIAEIVLREQGANIEQAVKAHLSELPRTQRPALVRFVTEIATTQTGKKARTP